MIFSQIFFCLILANPRPADTTGFSSVQSRHLEAKQRFSLEVLISPSFGDEKSGDDLLPRLGLNFFSPNYHEFWSWGLGLSHWRWRGDEFSTISNSNQISAQAISFDESLVSSLLFFQLQPRVLSLGGLGVFSRNGFEANLNIQHSNSVRETQFKAGAVFFSSFGLALEPEFLKKTSRRGWEFLLPKAFQASYTFRYLSQADQRLSADSLDLGIWFSL